VAPKGLKAVESALRAKDESAAKVAEAGRYIIWLKIQLLKKKI
jgi:hypothetical protein